MRQSFLLCVGSSRRLVTLARGLSPAFLRFGGKRTDFLQFNNQKNLAKFRGPGPDYYLKNYEDGSSSARALKRAPLPHLSPFFSSDVIISF